MHLFSGVPTLTHENLSTCIKNLTRRFGMTKSVKCETIDCCITCNDQNWDSHAKIDPKTISTYVG